VGRLYRRLRFPASKLNHESKIVEHLPGAPLKPDVGLSGCRALTQPATSTSGLAARGHYPVQLRQTSLALLRVPKAGLDDRGFVLLLVVIEDVQLAAFHCELYLVAHRHIRRL
jgi:hypothetical protein